MALTDEAMTQIKEMILRGDLSRGDRLPPEKELAEQLGLSRNSLREAVKALELMGVLDVRRGDGTYVTSLEPALLLEVLSFGSDLHGYRALLDIFATRRVLEAHAAGLAAQFATAEQLQGMHAEIERGLQAPDVHELVEHDIRLHNLVAEASGNTFLSSLLASLSSQTVRVRVWRGLTQASAVERTLQEHSALVDAIADRDVHRASSLGAAHIAGVEDWLRQSSATGGAS